MAQATPPNVVKRERDASSSTSSSSATITSQPNVRTPLAHEPLSPMLPYTPSHTATVHQSAGNETVERYDNTMAGSSIAPTSAASSLPKYVTRPEPAMLCGLLRSKPAALRAHPQQTYYSERSYPTPLTAPSPAAIAAQVEVIRRRRAEMKLPGAATETVAQRRHRQANERVSRYRNERTYRILDPRFQMVFEEEMPLLKESQSPPRLRFGSTPQDSSTTEMGDVPSSPPTLIGTYEPLEARSSNLRMAVSYSEDEGAGPVNSDIEMQEDDGAEAPDYMDTSDDDTDETFKGAPEALDSDEAEVKVEASDDEVMTADGAIYAETESQGSTEFEYDDIKTEDDHDSDYSDSSDTLQSQPKTKSKSKAAKSKSKLVHDVQKGASTQKTLSTQKASGIKKTLSIQKGFSSIQKVPVPKKTLSTQKAPGIKNTLSTQKGFSSTQKVPVIQKAVSNQKGPSTQKAPGSKKAPSTQKVPSTQKAPSTQKVSRTQKAPSNQKAPDTQKATSTPKPPIPTPSLNLPILNLPQTQPVTHIPFPRLSKGVNQHGYSRMILAIPRVVKYPAPK